MELAKSFRCYHGPCDPARRRIESSKILPKLPESPLLRMGMNGSPERSGGTSSWFLGFKEAQPFERGASL
jgi:hypothetical protein